MKAAWFALLALGACTPHSHDGESQQGHAHTPGAERPALSFTDWSAQTELFMELPALVKGEDSACAAHVTKLAGFEALASGRVTVVLSGGGQDERFVASKPTVPGIFRPVAQPKRSGKRRLIVEIEVGDLSARHDLGEVVVFDSDAAARKAIPEEQEPGGRITFLKEQQWPIPFATAVAEERTLSTSLHVPGTLIARPEADLVIRAPVAGRIVSDAAGFPRVGRQVAVGDALAILAPRLEAADIASLELAIQNGELEVGYAQNERKRIEALKQEGVVSERRVVEATHNESTARAALTTAQRRLSQFRRIQTTGAPGQSSFPLLSPLGGVLEEVYVAPGTFAEPGAPLFRVIDLTTLWLEAKVAEVDTAQVGTPHGASFTVQGGPSVELGTDSLVARSHALDPRTRTLSLWFTVDNRERGLNVGALSDVWILTGEPTSSLAVPETALVDDTGTAVLFVQVEGEAFERRIVRTGLRDRGYVAIDRGLSIGEHVVTRGAYAVKLAASSGSIPAHGHSH